MKRVATKLSLPSTPSQEPRVQLSNNELLSLIFHISQRPDDVDMVYNDNLHELPQLLMQIQDINFQDAAGKTPFIHACTSGSMRNIRAIFERDNSALSCAIKLSFIFNSGKDFEKINPLLITAKSGNIEAFNYLLDALPKMSLTTTERLQTLDSAFIMACVYNQQEIAAKLLDKKLVNINYTTPPTPHFTPNKSALTYACQFGRTDLAKFLIDRGANIDGIMIGKESNPGPSPLAMACYNNHKDAVNLMLENHADLASLNKTTPHTNKRTVLQYIANSPEHAEVYQIVVSKFNEVSNTPPPPPLSQSSGTQLSNVKRTNSRIN